MESEWTTRLVPMETSAMSWTEFSCASGVEAHQVDLLAGVALHQGRMRLKAGCFGLVPFLPSFSGDQP